MAFLSTLRKQSKRVAAFFLLQFTLQLGYPAISYALTSGPSQPEFSSFEPVATTNMVNDFTGDFTYNLPVLEVPGPHGSSYPMSLSYHSGVNQEEEASWVGYGWTLNAGAINRNTRGFPDDHNGKEVTFHNKMPKNWTVTTGGAISPEILGYDNLLNLNASIRYNNYRGFGYNAGIGINLPVSKGAVSLGYNVSEQGGRGSFSLQITPGGILEKNKDNKKKEVSKMSLIKGKEGRKQYLQDIGKKFNEKAGKQITGSKYTLTFFNDVSYPTAVTSYSGFSGNFSIGSNFTVPFFPAGASGNIFGSYNSQDNDPISKKNTYGYLYSSGATSNTDAIMDYQTEKDNGYDFRDVFLGVPFNMADNFSVSGEGIGGGFRLFHKRLGQFGPNTVESKTIIGQLGLEFDLGVGLFGGGGDIGVGGNTLKITDWNRSESTFLNPFPTSTTGIPSIDLDEPVFFKFNGDLSGEWGTNYHTAGLTPGPDDRPIIGQIFGSSVKIDQNLIRPNEGARTGRSSYIGFRTNGQISANDSYSKLHYNTTVDNDLIGEFAVFNEQGMRYVYALPVYNKNERNLSYGVQGASGAQVENNYYVYYKNDKTKIGEEMDSPYASAFLLTEITSPDYVDLTGDGPTQDDFGGYTRFSYEKIHDAYRWRIPYKGLNYAKNSHSDPQDDLGTMSSGEREVYYLKAIETKTHVAIFNFSDRSADAVEAGDADAPLFKTYTPLASAKKLKKLDKIDLYSAESYTNGLITRNAQGTPDTPTPGTQIKTVYFEYFSDGTALCQNAPNKLTSGGKLTLKRVFFEYNGVTRTRVSPYVFDYQYPDYSTYPTKYRNSGSDDVTGEHDNIPSIATSSEIQNPSYSEFNTDAWGNYQTGGQARYDRMQNWVDQNAKLGASFDPAAWHLKVIKLPSGGEIHVQYEQDDYNFVQDQRAHVMAKLQPSSTGNHYVLNLDKMGFSGITGATRVAYQNRLVSLLRERYINKPNKIYFKFLYTLFGLSSPSLNSCNADFITGYANVSGVGIEGNDVYINLSNDTNPKDVCIQFLKTQRLGKIDPSANCNASTGISDNTNVGGLVMQFFTLAASVVVPSTLCEIKNIDHSYLRVPTPLPKLGGGLRVKRLMMYDRGIEQVPVPVPVLYGNEYIYKSIDDQSAEISSGVATFEPTSMREENILVDFIARKEADWFQRIIAGDDVKETEGPLGESIYPAPVVGYSNVIVRNIHSGKTAPGFSVSEFYTAKDFPVVTRKTPILSPKPERSLPIGNPLLNISYEKVRAAQGFSFVLNDMHGQVRRQATYTGEYRDVTSPKKENLITEQVYEYFQPGESLPVQSSLYGGVTTGSYNPGREVDVTFAQKKITEISLDGNVEVDFSIGLIPFFIPIIIPFITGIPTLNSFDGELSVHTTSKVVRYPAIVKKIVAYQDGIYHTTENLAFDIETGSPVAVKSYDELKGAYLAQSVPASWEYPAVGAKWKTEGKKFLGSYPFDGTYIQFSSGTCDLAEFSEGDQVKIGTSPTALYHVLAIDGINYRLKVVPSMGSTPASSTNTEVTILHSGKTNELKLQAGAITFSSPVASGVGTVVIDQLNRYETGATNNFVNDLAAATQSLSGAGSFNLIGTYLGMDMSGFADKLTTCTTTSGIGNAKVKQLEYTYTIVGSQLDLKLMAFDIDCNGTWVTVAAEGWK